MLKNLRAVVIFLLIAIGGFLVLKWWLPSLLRGPSVVRLPPGARPPGMPGVEEEALPVPVRTFKATRIEFRDLLPTLGTVRGQSEVELKFEVNGVVKELHFREGDIVTEGQELAILEDRDARLRLEYAESKQRTAEAQLALAQKRLSVNEQLYRLGAIIKPKMEESQIEVEQAVGQVATAQKEADLARSEMAKTVLKAPIDGVMGTREMDIGEYVTPQATVATLMDVNSVFVELGIVERDIERIRLQQRVKVSVDSVPNQTFEGRIDNLAPVIEGKSRTLTAKVKVENPKGQLLPGMFARAEIAVFEKPDALVIPTSALRDADGDGKFESVFLVQGEKAAMKAITLGYLTTDYAEISDGLEEGEQVITEARGNLKEGSQISLLEEEEAAFERAEPAFPGDKR
jgi:membrane fusion protein (multidrug efflux system)